MQIYGSKTPLFLGNQDQQNQRRILEWVPLCPEHGYRLSNEKNEDVFWLDWIMQERLVHSQIYGSLLAFLYTLCKKDPSETLPTIGFNVETVKAKKYTFDIWVHIERDDYR